MNSDRDTVDSRPAEAPGADGPGPDDPPPSPRRLVRTALDAAAWGLFVFLVGAAALGLVNVASGSGLVGFKRGLFVFGFAAVGASLLALRPKRARTRGREAGDGGRSTGGGEGAGADDRSSDDLRASWGLRAFFGGVWALVASYLLEVVFGVVPV